MPGPEKQTNPSQDGTNRPDAGPAPAVSGLSADWLAKLRESDPGWEQPAFSATGAVAPRAPSPLSEQPMDNAHATTDFATETGTDLARETLWDEAEAPTPARPRRRTLAFAILGIAALAWLAAVVWTVASPAAGARLMPVLLGIATLSAPLVLLVALAALLLVATRRGTAPAEQTAHIRALTGQAAQATARLDDVQAQFLGQTRALSSAADQSAAAVLDAMRMAQEQSAQLDRSSAASIATLTALGERITAMTDALPRFEDRLATLAETLARIGGDLGQRHETLDQQLQTTALVAEEARAQMLETSTLLAGQLDGLKEGARQAGEELTNLSELSSARIDLTLDRVKSVTQTSEERIEAQNQALAQLVENSRTAIESSATHSLDQFAEHCRKVDTLLGALDTRLAEQAGKSGAWLDGTASGVAALADAFDGLERSALARNEALSGSMTRLSDETHQLVGAIEAGHSGSDALIQRGEALLLALDSSIRELDESIPGALERVETRLEALKQRIQTASPDIEAVEAVAAGVVSQLQESEQLAHGHVSALADALDRSQGALAAQKQQIEALAAAIGEAGAGMGRLGESAGPQMVEALTRVRETADAAAARARSAIADAIPEAAQALGTASSEAVQKALGTTVTEQIERIALAADDAVKAAHRATGELTERVLGLTEASKALETALADNGTRIEEQGREQLAQRSAHLIAALNEHAIDVGKWLDRDVTDAEWAAYLKGEQGLFARRAVKLVTGADAREVHTLYSDEAEFREQVNRYIHDFEALLRTVLATREGSTLALTMISSDIGKLYVALAQAIERLRPQ